MALGLGVLWFATLGMRPLFNPDEGRYGEIPREMLASGDWIVPHLNGLIYIEKPPLQYWMTAAAFTVFGEREGVVRLIPALFGYLGVLLIGAFAWHRGGTRACWAACAILASCPLYLVTAQFASLDMTVSFFLTLALVTFAYAQEHRARPVRAGRAMVICWAAMALATLTKGLIGVAIPGGVLVLYTIWTRDFQIWRYLSFCRGGLVLMVIAVPWYIMIAQRVPEFLDFFFVREHFERYLTDAAHRQQAWWYFLAVLMTGVLVWTPQMVRAFGMSLNKNPSTPNGFQLNALLCVWVGFVVVFFSFSHSKLPGYIVPAVPALALMVAFSESLPARNISVSAILSMLSGFALSVAALRESDALSPLIPRLLELQPMHRLQLLKEIAAAGAILLVTSGIAVLLARRRYRTGATLMVAWGWIFALIIALAAMRLANPLYSGSQLAEVIAKERADRGRFEEFYQVEQYDQTLPFYLKQTSVLVGYRGELDFGIRHAPDRWLADRLELRERWISHAQSLAVMSSSTYAQLAAEKWPMRVIARDGNQVAIARR